MDLDTDSPIENFSQDELAFLPFAQGLARQILNLNRPKSFVVGVNGQWGAGKTSLVNLIEEALLKESGTRDNAPQVIVLRFSPWIIGNRSALLTQLLPAITSKIRQQLPSYRSTLELKGALRTLERYGRALQGVEHGLSIATATAAIFGFAVGPSLAWLPAFFTQVGGALRLIKATPPTLDELRDMAQASLSKAAIRVLVIIDDLDRLEPAEVLEISRLVRSTLDLPHVTFMLAYDREQVVKSISNQLSINGEDYLEKIVQLPLNVPEVSSFDLAQLLSDRLKPIFGELDAQQKERVAMVIWRDIRALFLKTPRDVGRILNSAAFGFSMIGKDADPADLLLISALLMKAPRTYGWFRRYSEAYHIDTNTTFRIAELAAEFLDQLKEACEVDGLNYNKTGELVRRTLAGIAVTNNALILFGNQTREDAATATREKRLSSGMYWRGYFDLTPGRYGFDASSFDAFVVHAVREFVTSDSRNNNFNSTSSDWLISMAAKGPPSGGTLAEQVIDHIDSVARGSSLSEAQRTALFRVLSDAVDRVARAVGPARFFGVSVFWLAESAAHSLLAPLPSEDRAKLFIEQVSSGASLSWLMYLLRSQLFAHGRIGSRDSAAKQLLTNDQLDQACSAGLARIINEASRGTLSHSYELAIPLLVWRDLEPEKTQLIRWIETQISSDEGAIFFVRALKQLVRSSAGDYWKVDPAVVDLFCDSEALKRRLEALSIDAKSSLKHSAAEALKLLARGSDH